jgi:hypothetical protein
MPGGRRNGEAHCGAADDAIRGSKGGGDTGVKVRRSNSVPFKMNDEKLGNMRSNPVSRVSQGFGTGTQKQIEIATEHS